MVRLARVSYRELAAKLRRAGYEEIRTSRHPVYYLAEKNTTIPVPKHRGEVPIGTLRAIVREMGLSAEEFNAL
jgi:predicted RNA binding protein YcfA (HicA-like mRNA interferase family)